MAQVNITTIKTPIVGWQCGNRVAGKDATEAAIVALPQFWGKVKRSGGCWLWTASTDASGYGQITYRGQKRKAHRLAWELQCGTPPPRYAHICHACDVKTCVRGSHLFLGDHDANNKDAASKGRLHVGRPKHRKLTNEDIEIILTAPEARGVIAAMAREFGVSKCYVSMLRRGLRTRLFNSRERQPSVRLRNRLTALQQHLNKPVNGRQG